MKTTSNSIYLLVAGVEILANVSCMTTMFVFDLRSNGVLQNQKLEANVKVEKRPWALGRPQLGSIFIYYCSMYGVLFSIVLLACRTFGVAGEENRDIISGCAPRVF